MEKESLSFAESFLVIKRGREKERKKESRGVAYLSPTLELKDNSGKRTGFY